MSAALPSAGAAASAGAADSSGPGCWPRARAGIESRAVMKLHPEDFRVDEVAGFTPTGEGEHLYLRIEKTGAATSELARALARAFAVPDASVGYAGMKDRHAVTTQWFSIQTPLDHPPGGALALPDFTGVRVLEACRHRRKLRRGELAGNRFRIRLRRVTGETWPGRLEALRSGGAPNYFGPQRFGGDNLAAARAWLGERRRRRLGAFRSGLYLSVLRSLLFNEVLAARVRAGTWNRVLPGEVTQDDPAGTPRPTGPLWGRGRSAAAAEALAVEQGALAPHAELCEGLEHAGLRQARRVLVLEAADLGWERDGDQLELTFALPAGGYATTFLAEAFDLQDRAGRG